MNGEMTINTKCPINPTLLWEYDLSTFDWWKGRTIVVQRVIERGDFSDFEGIYELYGGKDKVRDIIREIGKLSPINTNFVCRYFNLKKEDLKGYWQRLRREAYFNNDQETFDEVNYEMECIQTEVDANR